MTERGSPCSRDTSAGFTLRWGAAAGQQAGRFPQSLTGPSPQLDGGVSLWWWMPDTVPSINDRLAAHSASAEAAQAAAGPAEGSATATRTTWTTWTTRGPLRACRTHDEALARLLEWALLHAVLLALMGLVLAVIIGRFNTLPLDGIVRALGAG